MLAVNYPAVVVAAVVALVVGAVWYSPLGFGKAYMDARGMDPGALADTRPPVPELLGELAENGLERSRLCPHDRRISLHPDRAALRLGT